MPEHVHLICTPFRDETGELVPLYRILQKIKSFTAHEINAVLKRSGPVWQDESFDHALRKEETLAAKVEYLKKNPVRRGFVKKPEEYKWLWSEDMVDWS